MGQKARERREKWAKINEAREIEGLLERARLKDYILARVDFSGSDLNSTLPWIEKSIVFDASELVEYLVDCTKGVDLADITSPTRPIFDEDTMFIEIGDMGWLIFPLFSNEYEPPAGLGNPPFWFVMGCMYIEDDTLLNMSWSVGLDYDYRPICSYSGLADSPQYLSNRSELFIGLRILQLINANNIGFIDHNPDPGDSALYNRHYGIPMTKYKTLAIKTLNKRYDVLDNPQQQFDVMPLHLRRGNFAHYTDDAPLFGKYTGTFWRPATVVGNAKNGVVVKDYKVVPPAEE